MGLGDVYKRQVSDTTLSRTPERLVKAEPSPLNAVADKVPLAELKVRLDPLLRAKLPVAAVVNIGKQVVSLDSSATGIVVAAGKLVKLAPDIAGRVAGNLASGIVPEARLDALSAVKLAPEPLNVVAVTIPDIICGPPTI